MFPFLAGPVARGALFSFLGFTAWAFSDAMAKGAGLGGASLPVIVGLSSWAAALTVLLGLWLRKSSFDRLRIHNKKIHAIRAFFFFQVAFVGVICFTNLPLTTVYIGIFSAPFLISLAGSVFMGEPLSRRQMISILIGFCGVLLALVPEISAGTTGPGNPLLGYICLPFFLIIFVINNLYLRILGRTETPENMTFWPFFSRALILTPFLLTPAAFDLSWIHLALICGVGVAGGVGFLLMSAAYKLAPLSVASFFHYTQLITGAILGYLFWDTVPSRWVWAGACLIVVAGWSMTHDVRKPKQQLESEACS